MAQKKFGSIRVLKSGRVQARYTLRTGEQVSAGTFETEWDAWVRLNEIEVDLRRKVHRDDRMGKIRFKDYMAEYMDERQHAVTKGELANNRSYLKVHLLPAFGNVRLEDLDKKTVTKWFAAMGHSETRRNVYTFFRAAMKAAEDDNYIQFSPCSVKTPGKGLNKPRPTWSLRDLERVLDCLPTVIRVNNARTLTPVYYREALEVMFAAHLRLGELVGLNVNDFDRSTGLLRVERQVTGLGHTTPTKTGVSDSLHLLDVGVAAINRLPMRVGAMPLIPGAVSPRMPRGSLQKAWRRAVVEAGFENFHIHDIRHIGLTMVTVAGAPLKDVMARGRHKSVESAMRYQHTDKSRDREVADEMNRILSGWRAEGQRAG